MNVKTTGAAAACIVLLLSPAQLMPIGPAGAVDLNGKRLLVEAMSEDAKAGTSVPRTVEIAGTAGLVHWPTLPTVCAVNGAGAGLAMVFGPEPNRSGRIDCDPQRQGTGTGGSEGNSLRALAATYRSTYGNAADTLALTGRMTIRESTKSPAETDDATTDVKQAITVRVAGAQCEVLDFVFEMTTQRKITRQSPRGRADAKTTASDTHERWTVPDRRRCTVLAPGAGR